MLSKVSTLILGIIKERPVNPYEINKFLEVIKVKDWFPVAVSSVYATIKTLQVKGYIKGEVMKEGNMPEKTIYSITEEGKRVFKQTIAETLSTGELDPIAFNIGTIMMCHLEKGSLLELLESRLKKIQSEIQAINSQYSYFIEIKKDSAYAIISLKHNMYLYEAELRTTFELIREMQDNQGWDHFLTRQSPEAIIG